MSGTTGSRARTTTGALVAFLGMLLAFYVWTAITTAHPYQFLPPGYHNLQAEAFLAGRLALLVPPKAELLALRDPYDPNANASLRLHDLSLYGGRYYLSWGPTPALVLFAPFKLLSGRYLRQDLAVPLFLFGGVVWSVALLRFLTTVYLPATPAWMSLAATASLGLCNVAPFLLRRPEVYEVALSSGYFFLSGSLYWLVSGALTERHRSGRLAMGSLFLGLAVGSRPHYALAVIVPLVLWVNMARLPDRRRGSGRAALAAFGPFLACLALLAVYNHARFGAFAEFGSRYQLAGIYMHGYQFFDPSRTLSGLYWYLWHPARLSATFPFFHLFHHHGSEAIAGILPNIPFVNVLWLAPWLIARRRTGGDAHLALLVEVLTLLALFFVVLLSTVFPPTMRYDLDFIGLLLVSAALVWFWLHREWTGQRLRIALLTFVGVGAIAYGCLFNLAIGMTGYFDWFRLYNPAGYHRIQRMFAPLERVLEGLF